MKIISFLACFCLSASAFAAVWNCPVKNESKPAGQPNEKVMVEFDQDLQAVTYIHQVQNSDGTFTEKPEPLYSTDKIRGGVAIAYCESDQGHIALEYKMVNWNSKCSTAVKQNPLNFVVDFHLDEPGYVQVQILDLSGGGAADVNRFIRVAACN